VFGREKAPVPLERIEVTIGPTANIHGDLVCDGIVKNRPAVYEGQHQDGQQRHHYRKRDGSTPRSTRRMCQFRGRPRALLWPKDAWRSCPPAVWPT